MKSKNYSIVILLIFVQFVLRSQNTYYSTPTANTWSLTSGGASCGCSPTASDYVVIEHNWANGSFYPLTHPANLAFGNFFSVNPIRVTVKNGGVAYQQPNLATGTEIYVESGGFWGYNGSLNLDAVNANAIKVMQNEGTILVNGSYNNDIAIAGSGVFCKNGSWINDANGSLRGITDANMDAYFIDDAYGCINCCFNSSSLPVELSSFITEKIDNNVAVKWTTSSEINNDFFELQFSEDIVNWITMASIKGAGNTNNVTDYSYLDTDISGYKIKYYRLKQVDFDGSIKFSFIRWTELESKDGSFEVYQNDDDISVVLDYKLPITQIKLIDINGQELAAKLQGVLITNNSYIFNKSNLSVGVYFIQVVSTNEIISKKIVVRN